MRTGFVGQIVPLGLGKEKSEIRKVIEGSNLYKPFQTEERSSLLERIVGTWKRGRGVEGHIGLLSDLGHGEQILALHLLGRHVSPTLADQCRERLNSGSGA